MTLHLLPPAHGHLSADIIHWYAENARELPWRNDEVSAWGIFVSEFMLQQTQVDRVIPRWLHWMERWPTPTALAAAPVNEVIVAWDRLGYPRRALWLHRAATTMVNDFNGEVPTELDDLLSLTGVGEYTARAVAVFAHRQRHPVVDTNVRRVLNRTLRGQAEAGSPQHRHDHELAETVLPDDAETACTFSYAIMEFGAVICTSRSPKCGECPIVAHCAWARSGFPAYAGKRVKPQAKFEGSDRQARGSIMAILRQNPKQSFSATALCVHISDADQAGRALRTLVTDGLIAQSEDSYRLP